MGQQQIIDAGRVKPEIIGVFLVQFSAALVEAAVDEDTLAGAFNQVARPGNAAIRAVEGDLHSLALLLFR